MSLIVDRTMVKVIEGLEKCEEKLTQIKDNNRFPKTTTMVAGIAITSVIAITVKPWILPGVIGGYSSYKMFWK